MKVACQREHLVSRGMPVVFPTPRPAGERKREVRSMYDVCVVLTMNRPAVANTINTNRKNLVIITGANQGGSPLFSAAWVLLS